MVSNAKDVCRQETGKRDVFWREKSFDFRGEHATQVDGGVGAFDEGAAEGEVAAGHGRGSLRSGDGGCQGEGLFHFKQQTVALKRQTTGGGFCDMFTLS